jgi:hypothetical protein
MTHRCWQPGTSPTPLLAVYASKQMGQSSMMLVRVGSVQNRRDLLQKSGHVGSKHVSFIRSGASFRHHMHAAAWAHSPLRVHAQGISICEIGMDKGGRS